MTSGSFIFAPSVYWTAATVCLSIVLAAVFAKTRWRAAIAWTALSFAGQACSLQLLNVGSANLLQKFHSWGTLLGTWRAVFLLALALQAALVAWGVWRQWSHWRGGFFRSLTVGHWLFLAILFAFAAMPLSPSRQFTLLGSVELGALAIHSTKVIFSMAIFAIGAANLALAVSAIPRDTSQSLQARWQNANRRWLPWLAALWVVCIAALFSTVVFERLPHIPDEVGYVFMAKYLAQGKLFLPPPPEPEAFTASFLVIEGGRWHSVQLPGWPSVLAVGTWLGLPWLVNPLLGGAAILLAHALVRRIRDRDTADVVALLLAGSPWLLYMSASLMPHPASLVFSCAALLGIHEARERGSVTYGALAGLSFGALLHTRPLEAIVLATFAGIWWLGAGWRKLRMPALAATVVCGLALTALFLAYNRTITGDPLKVPFGTFMDEPGKPGPNRLGFGREFGNFGWNHLDPLPGHGPLDVIINSNHNFYMIQFEMFGWASGSLLCVFLLAVWGKWKAEAWCWWLLLILWAGLNTYWFSGGPDFGARYWYQMQLPLALLTVSGAAEFQKRTAAFGSSGPRVWAYVVMASVLGCVNLLPWRALDKYTNYREVRADVRRLANEYHFGRSLVLIRGEKPVNTFASSAFYSAFALNPARFDKDVDAPIYALDLGAESRERLRASYSDRPVWVLASPAITRDGFRVIAGPIPPGQPIPSE